MHRSRHTGLHRLSLAVPARLSVWLLAAACLVGGCGGAARNTAAVHPVQTPRATAPAVTTPPAGPAKQTAAVTPQPAAQVGAEQVQKQAEASFEAAEQDYKAGRIDPARQGFDRALDTILDSGVNLSSNPQLAELFQRIVDTAHNDALLAMQSGDESGQPKSTPAPIDEIESMTFSPEGVPTAPVDAQLRTRAEGELADVQHDLPLTVNDIVLSFLNFFQTPHGRAIVETGLRRAGRYRPMIQNVLREEGLPSDLMYIAQAESAFQPQALSRAGARGLWQFMSYRGKQYGLEHSWWVNDRQDPQKATEAAAHHLRDLYQMFGDWYLVMAAYNSGPGTVQHAVERTGYADFWELYKLNALPKETKNYVPIILALTLIAKDPARYGMDVDPEEPVRTDHVQPGHPIDLRLVAETIDSDLDTLRALNPQLLRLVTPSDPSFILQLPEGAGPRFRADIAAIPPDKWLSWRRHRVEEGETLSNIAQQYRVTAAAIAGANDIEVHASLEPGAKLIIPIAPHSELSLGKLVRYRARQSDTLASIADEFDVTVPELKKWNHLRGNQTARGMLLRIYPGEIGSAPGEKTAEKTPDRSTVSGSKTADGTVVAKSRSAHDTSTSAEPAADPSAEPSAEPSVEPSADPKLDAKPSTRSAAKPPAAGSGRSQTSEKTTDRVAAAHAVVHHVKPGETLYSIARTYQTTVAALRSGNRFLFSRPLETGDTLLIPAKP